MELPNFLKDWGGGNTALFHSTNNWNLSTTDRINEFTFNTGDFTFSWFYKPLPSGSYYTQGGQNIIGVIDRGCSLVHVFTNKIALGSSYMGYSTEIAFDITTLSPDKFYNFAFIRYNGIISFYLDGKLIGQNADNHNFYINSNEIFILSQNSSGHNTTLGSVDNYCIANHAIYTSEFIPKKITLSNSLFENNDNIYGIPK